MGAQSFFGPGIGIGETYGSHSMTLMQKVTLCLQKQNECHVKTQVAIILQKCQCKGSCDVGFGAGCGFGIGWGFGGLSLIQLLLCVTLTSGQIAGM